MASLSNVIDGSAVNLCFQCVQTGESGYHVDNAEMYK